MKFLSICLWATAAIAADDGVLLPAPKGEYATDIKLVQLVDQNRVDPYDPDHGARRVMVSVIYPTVPAHECHDPKPFQYAPIKTSDFVGPLLDAYGWPNATGYFKRLRLPVCSLPKQSWWSARNHKEPKKNFPVVLFSHGLGAFRLASSSQAQAVASQGYVVITIDHPYDAGVVEFLDGSLVFGKNLTTVQELDEDTRVRSQDASFVLDELKRPNSQLQIPAVCGVDTEKVAMFGHSLGGATSIRAVYDDKRMLGAVDMDGFPYGFNTTGSYLLNEPATVLPHIDRPFMLFSNPTNTHTPGFQETLSNFTGWKLSLELEDSRHLTFTDLPLLVDTFGLRDQLPPTFAETTGTIDGLKARDAVAAYIGAFMDKVLKGKDSKLLHRPSGAYPEITFVS